MSLFAIERELINRGYRIKYRRPDDHFVVTYQLARGDWTGGFRITEQVADKMIPGSEGKLIDLIERDQWSPR